MFWEHLFLWIWNAIISITWHSGHNRNCPEYLISTSQLNQSSGVVQKQVVLCNADEPAFQGSVHHCFSLSLTLGTESRWWTPFLCKALFILYAFAVNMVALCIIPLHFSNWLFQPIVSTSVPLSPEGWGEGECLVWSLISSFIYNTLYTEAKRLNISPLVLLMIPLFISLSICYLLGPEKCILFLLRINISVVQCFHGMT